jgi:RecA-family ATPase
MSTTIENRQQEISTLHFEVFGHQDEERVDSRNNCNNSASRPRARLDDYILEKARSAANGDKFERLYAGKATAEYDSPSEADLALCSMLAFRTQDPEQIDRLFKASKRYRPKWDERHAADASTYGELTINKALQNTQPLPSDTTQSHLDELVIFSAKDLIRKTSHTEIPWVWEGYLAHGDITIFVSRPKLGKSTLTWQLVKAIILNNSFLNAKTAPQKTLVLAVEENPALVRQRLVKHGLEDSDDLFIKSGLCHPTPKFHSKLKEKILYHKIGVLIIDTLTAFWDVSDENNAAQVVRALKPLQELAQSTGVAILLLHHARKGEEAPPFLPPQLFLFR